MLFINYMTPKEILSYTHVGKLVFFIKIKVLEAILSTTF